MNSLPMTKPRNSITFLWNLHFLSGLTALVLVVVLVFLARAVCAP